MTKIQKAKELVSEIGKDKAIAFFQERIKAIGKPETFQQVCEISGNEVAINFIKEKL